MNIKDHIAKTAQQIQPQLNPLPTHSTRNAYAHIHGIIKMLCGTSYSYTDKAKVQAILKAIENNPNGTPKEIFEQAKLIYKQQKAGKADS